MKKLNHKIYIKKAKKANTSRTKRFMDNLEEWVSYWRSNPHRFICDYLGLKLYDFQKVLIYMMFKYPSFILVASRGLAKSTLSLIFAIAYCILYPGVRVLVVAPTKSQSTRFVKKIYDLKRNRKNLEREIKTISTGVNDTKIEFANDSVIFTTPYSENALGVRANILIVDEYVRTEKSVIEKTFVPMLSSYRAPEYVDLSKAERDSMPNELNRQLYLSSIRGANEWSYKEFLTYLNNMTNGENYFTVALPYNLGVKNRYISRGIVEQSFKTNQDSIESLASEYLCIPERGMNNAFYSYNMIAERQEEARAMVAMTDEEYLTYKNDKSQFPFYQEKLPNEIRILTMDVALVESSKNDNTAFWIIRLIPEGHKYKKIFSFAESMNGINSIIQAKRAKQLFYEFDCDYFVLDAGGVGVGIFDICTQETIDEDRDEIYPAWTVINPEDTKSINRTLDPNAVPVVYSVKTTLADKSRMLINSRDELSTNRISLLVDMKDGIDYLNENFEFYKIIDQNLRTRVLNSYAQTSAFINEAINLKQVIVQGRISAEEKSGRRKDRVMAMVYGLDFAKSLEDNLNKDESTNILDYCFFS